MNSSLILRAHEMADNYLLSHLSDLKPDSIVFSIEEPKDMKFLERFSKLEIPHFPMFKLGELNMEVLYDMMNQAVIILEPKALYLQVSGALNSRTEVILDALQIFLLTILPLPSKAKIFVAASASQFFENSNAVYLCNGLDKLDADVHPLLMLSNTEESLAIFKSRKYMDMLRANEGAQFSIQMIVHDTGIVPQMLEIFNWHRPVFFWGFGNLAWFQDKARGLLQEKVPAEPVYDGPQPVAYAEVVYDRSSAWQDTRCLTKTVRKFNKGDPDLWVMEILPGNIGKTREGDYINLAIFKVKKV